MTLIYLLYRRKQKGRILVTPILQQSIESIKSWSDDYDVDIFVHSDVELDEFKCKSNLVLHDDEKFIDKLLQVRLFIQHHLNREYDTYIMSEGSRWRQETLEYFEEVTMIDFGLKKL